MDSIRVWDVRSSHLFNFLVLLTIHIFIRFYTCTRTYSFKLYVYLIYLVIKVLWEIVMVEIAHANMIEPEGKIRE